MATTNSSNAVEQPTSAKAANTATTTLQDSHKASTTSAATGAAAAAPVSATPVVTNNTTVNGGSGSIPVATPPLSSSILVVTLSSKPTLIEVMPMRFVIMDAPRQANLHLYVKELSKYHVQDIVRVCEPTYHADSLQNAGIGLHDMEYHDGHSPPNDILERWLQLVERTFYNNNTTNAPQDSAPALAVHCVAGLGRAPVLVAIALMEFAHMDAVEAVTLIRRHRRGAINEKQLIYLEGYKRRYKRKLSNGAQSSSDCHCIIM